MLVTADSVSRKVISRTSRLFRVRLPSSTSIIWSSSTRTPTHAETHIHHESPPYCSPLPAVNFSLASPKRALIKILTALIHASPDYYAVYRRDRDTMLKDTVRRTLSAYGIRAFEPGYKAPVYFLAHRAAEVFVENNAQALKHCFDRTDFVIEETTIILSLKQYLSFSSLECVTESHLHEEGRYRPYGWEVWPRTYLEYRLLCFDCPGAWILPCNPVWGWADLKASSSLWEALGAIEISKNRRSRSDVCRLHAETIA